MILLDTNVLTRMTRSREPQAVTARAAVHTLPGSSRSTSRTSAICRSRFSIPLRLDKGCLGVRLRPGACDPLRHARLGLPRRQVEERGLVRQPQAGNPLVELPDLEPAEVDRMPEPSRRYAAEFVAADLGEEIVPAPARGPARRSEAASGPAGVDQPAPFEALPPPGGSGVDWLTVNLPCGRDSSTPLGYADPPSCGRS